jgi:hypothetical protein
MTQGTRAITVLVVLNLALQIFDGVATYVGWERYGELNPLLLAAFERWGAGPSLVVAKLAAAGLVLVLAGIPRRTLATVGLGITFTAYTALSFVPWTFRLLGA